MIDEARRMVDELGHEQVSRLEPELLAAALLHFTHGYPLNAPNVDPALNAEEREMGIQMMAIELPQMAKANADSELPQKHLAEIFSFEIHDLMDALATGKDHPVLDRWMKRRTQNRNRQTPTRRGVMLRNIAVLGTEWLKDIGFPYTRGYIEVARIANATGVFVEHIDHGGDVTPAAVRHWREAAMSNNDLPRSRQGGLGDILGLETPAKSEIEQSRLFRFWCEVIRRSFLAFGTSVIHQMVQSGRDPFADYPEDIRRSYYGQAG